MATQAENMERAEQDDREWHTARLHRIEHGNWLGPDECATCMEESLNREGDPAFNGAFNRW